MNKRKRIVSIFLTILMMVTVLASFPMSAGAQNELLSNTTFTSLDGWDVNPTHFALTYDASKSHTDDGSGSMMADYSNVVNIDPGKGYAWTIQAYYRNLPVVAGKTYTFSFWYYAEDGTPSVAVDYCDGNASRATNCQSIGNAGVKNEWTKYAFKFSVLDTTDACVRILTTEQKDSGHIWFDDVSLTETADTSGGETVDDVPDKTMCPNGSFENGTGANASYWLEEVNTKRASVKEIEEQYGDKYDLTDFKAGVDGDHVMMFTHKSTRVVKGGSPITVKPNTNYLFKANIYRVDGKGVTYISLLNGAGADLAGTSSGTETPGQWVTCTVTWNSGNMTQVIPRMVIDNSPSGEPVFFDDLQFIELDYEETNPLPVDETLSDAAIRFDLATAQTKASFAFDNDAAYITSLADKNGTSWINAAQKLQLVEKISGEKVTWKLNGAPELKKLNEAVDKGYRIEAKFVSSDGLYNMNYYIEALEGAGPIEVWSEITCDSKESYYAYPDVLSSNMKLNRQNGEQTLYYFNRGRVNDGSDPLFLKGGILSEKLTTNDVYANSVENGCNVTTGTLPYQMIDVDGKNGFYFGYYWSFGKIIVRTNDEGKIGVLTNLSNDPTATVKRDAGVTMNVPSYFFGVYTGDIDDGSNCMKRWFWDYKITRSLHDNADEPHIETDTMSSTPADNAKLFEIAPELKDLIQVIKVDYHWTLPNGIDPRVDKVTEDKWLPNEKYPNGMVNWAYLNSIGLKFSLYMSDTYQAVNIGTQDGRMAQLNALKERFGTPENRATDSGWATGVHGYDYWRSDFDVEGTYDYAKHEGLLYILDEMIAYSDDFRYEHCSGGGSLKDFSTLERMSFMTNEDTARPINHRICLYAASYMINPVQLKADLNMTYNDKDFGAITKNNPQHGYSTSKYICTDADGNMVNVWENPEYILYSLRSGFLGSTMVCFNKAGVELNKDMITQQWSLYKNKQRAILRGANVYHILEQPSGIPWDWADWDGLMFYNKDIEQGSVLVFRENDTVGETKVPTEKTIKLKGLEADAMYEVSFEDRTELGGRFTGAQLMNDGLYINNMTEQYDSECIFLTKIVDMPIETVDFTQPEKITVGKPAQLTAVITPVEAADKKVTWEVINFTGTATIDQNGLLTPLTAGKVIVKITSADNRDITTLKLVTINAPAKVSINTLKVKLAATLYTYDGKVKKPAVTVTDAKGKKIASSNYTVTYASGRKLPGTYVVKVTMKGSYTGSKTLTFAIRGKQMAVSKLTALSKGFKATWKKQSYVTGYQVQYSTSSKFTAKTTKHSTINKYTTTSKTVTKLKAKTKYYVRVRSYKTTKIGGKNYNVYSAWSKAKTITTKK